MYKTKYKYDEKVFDKLNEKSAYWIGYLMADGYINGNRIQFALSSKDEDCLKQFKDFLKSPNRPIRKFKNKYYTQNYSEIRIRSWGLVNALKKYKLHINKKERGRINIDLLQKNIRRHFMRGYFDGDGCFYVDNRGYLFAELASNKAHLKDLKQILVSDTIISEHKHLTKNGKSFRLRLCASNTLKLGEYLYKGYPNIYRNQRKYNIYHAHAERLNNSGDDLGHLKRQSN